MVRQMEGYIIDMRELNDMQLLTFISCWIFGGETKVKENGEKSFHQISVSRKYHGVTHDNPSTTDRSGRENHVLVQTAYSVQRVHQFYSESRYVLFRNHSLGFSIILFFFNIRFDF